MSLLCLPPTSSPAPTVHSSSVVVKNCLQIWNQFRWHFGLQVIPVLAPVHSNPLFTPSVIDKVFKIWKDLGIVSIKQLYISGIFASFDQLTQAFNLQPTISFFIFASQRFCSQWFSLASLSSLPLISLIQYLVLTPISTFQFQYCTILISKVRQQPLMLYAILGLQSLVRI